MGERFILGNADNSKLGNIIKCNNYDVESIDLNNMNDSHTLIVNEIKKGTVLDVGCSTGIIGRTLKLIKNDIVVDGIELDKEAYNEIKKNKVYNDLYNINICDFDNNNTKKFYDSNKKYDYIIFADVLEHLINPDEVLYKMSKKLSKNGVIIISIPNVSHIDIIRSLINNEFNYNDRGILDSTHLRFFTKNSFCDMIHNIEERYNVCYKVELFAQTKAFPSDINAIDTALFNTCNNLEEYSVVQNLFKVSNTKSRRIQKRDSLDYFEEMNRSYNNVINNNKKLVEENLELKTEIEELRKTINNIVNSKRYKVIDKMAKIIKH